MTNGRVGRASQTLAAERLSLGLVEASRGEARQREPEVRQRRDPRVRLEVLAGETDCFTSRSLGAVVSPLLGIDQRE